MGSLYRNVRARLFLRPAAISPFTRAHEKCLSKFNQCRRQWCSPFKVRKRNLPRPSGGVSSRVSADCNWRIEADCNFVLCASEALVDNVQMFFLWWPFSWHLLWNIHTNEKNSFPRCYRARFQSETVSICHSQRRMHNVKMWNQSWIWLSQLIKMEAKIRRYVYWLRGAKVW